MIESQFQGDIKKTEYVIQKNLEDKWWLKKEYQPEEYQNKEIERAMIKILQIFNNQWLKEALNESQRDKRKPHLMITYLKQKGSYSLSILIGLGNNLIKIESLKNSERLIKEIKKSTKFSSTAFEAEIAAECISKEFDVELYPELCGKNPDLKIIFKSRIVYFEITEIRPSQRINRFYSNFNNLFAYVNLLIPENTSIRLTPDKLISNHQFSQISNQLKHQIKNHSLLPTSLKIGNLTVNPSLTLFTSFFSRICSILSGKTI